MNKRFEKTLSNNATIVLDYTMSIQYDEPLATINNNNFSWWVVADIRNSILSYMDITLSIHDIIFTKEDLDELYDFCQSTEREYDKQIRDEEEKYNGPKEG